MKTKFLAALVVLSLSLFSQRGVRRRAKRPPPPNSRTWWQRSTPSWSRARGLKRTSAPELKEFDALLAKHKGEKTDEVAQILFMEAMLYLQVLDNTDKGDELIEQLQRDFPDTKPAQNADKMLAR